MTGFIKSFVAGLSSSIAHIVAGVSTDFSWFETEFSDFKRLFFFSEGLYSDFRFPYLIFSHEGAP